MILFHGDNLVASRNALTTTIEETKKRGVTDIVRLNGEKVELVDLKQALESHSRFSTERLIVIENLLARKRSKAKDELTDFLKTADTTKNVLLWERKPATPSQIKKLPGTAKIQVFKIGPKIFKFLDAVAPKNTKHMLLSMHECIKQESPEMVFYMLSRRIAKLTIACDLGIKGLNGMQDWQKTRILRQAKRFRLPQLLSLHEKLYETDKSIKTGRNVLPLSSMLDLIIAEI